ncbi:MAG: hypothetical protein N4Q30_03950, partial [Neisseriaceae bacterium]|nr:hypothetical protein [Neisseriaceae bacterium]
MNIVIDKLKKNIDSELTLAYSENNIWSYQDFWLKVFNLKNQLEQESYTDYCLWEDNGYYFLVSFFALLLSNKQVYLPPNNLISTIHSLALRNIFNFKYDTYAVSEHSNANAVLPSSIDWDALLNNSFFMQTSGSTGEPKLIERKLIQLFRETLFL